MNYIDLYIKNSIAELSGRPKRKRRKPTKADKKSKTNWSWEKYKFTPKKKEIKSNLKAIDPKLKYRTFDGKIHKERPVNAFGMDSYVGADVGLGHQGTPSVDAGYGMGTYGVTPYGEALNRAAAKLRSGLKNLKGDVSEDVIKAMLDGYASMFTRLVGNSSLVMHGIQPSMSAHFGFDIEQFIDAFNAYEGTVYSLVLSEASSLEPIREIAKWMVHNGAKKEKVDSVIFIEKISKCRLGDEATTIPHPEGECDSENVISNYADLAELMSSLHDPVLVGCIDPYMIGETMLACEMASEKYQVDERYIYSI